MKLFLGLFLLCVAAGLLLMVLAMIPGPVWAFLAICAAVAALLTLAIKAWKGTPALQGEIGGAIPAGLGWARLSRGRKAAILGVGALALLILIAVTTA